MVKPTLGQQMAGIVHVSGGHTAPPDVTDDDEDFGCCWGTVMNGPTGCTCWEPIFDVEQAECAPVPSAIPVRALWCRDCAYRKGSPERSDDYEEEALIELARSGRGQFLCHQGMRRAVAYRHPATGRELPAGPGDYQPPQDGKVSWKADGTVADLCAGWAAYARKGAKNG